MTRLERLGELGEERLDASGGGGGVVVGLALLLRSGSGGCGRLLLYRLAASEKSEELLQSAESAPWVRLT